MFVGGFIAALGLFLCAFANDIYMVFISFGLLTGTKTLWHNEKIKSRRLLKQQEPFPKSDGHPKSMNKLTLNEPAMEI